MNKTDITTMDDVRLLVNTFYDKVRDDSSLSPIFESKIQDRWPEHLNKMYRFWQTVLLGEHTYKGSPFIPHATLPVQLVHFETWLSLFNTTVDDLFKGPKADRAKWQGQRMAEMFHSKIKYYKNNSAIPILWKNGDIKTN